MALGRYYDANAKKIKSLTDDDWRVAIKKCQEHVRWKVRQRTLYGAHAPERLGMDPIDYYVDLAHEKVIAGDWEWKDQFTISEQMIRIADSHISTEVEKSKTKKAESVSIRFTDEIELYEVEDDFDEAQEKEFQDRFDAVDKAVAGEKELEELWECVKAGYKRSEIAELMSLKPRQLDKLKERLVERVRKLATANKEK